MLVEDPIRGLERLVAQMRAFWDALLEPWWRRMAAVLESEIAWRARRLAAEGPGAAFADLHHTVHWKDDALYVEPTGKTAADVDLAGRGLLLVPAAFTWPLVWPRTDPPWDPALVYTPPGVGELWAPVTQRQARSANCSAAAGRACCSRSNGRRRRSTSHTSSR